MPGRDNHVYFTFYFLQLFCLTGHLVMIYQGAELKKGRILAERFLKFGHLYVPYDTIFLWNLLIRNILLLSRTELEAVVPAWVAAFQKKIREIDSKRCKPFQW